MAKPTRVDRGRVAGEDLACEQKECLPARDGRRGRRGGGSGSHELRRRGVGTRRNAPDRLVAGRRLARSRPLVRGHLVVDRLGDLFQPRHLSGSPGPRRLAGRPRRRQRLGRARPWTDIRVPHPEGFALLEREAAHGCELRGRDQPRAQSDHEHAGGGRRGHRAGHRRRSGGHRRQGEDGFRHRRQRHHAHGQAHRAPPGHPRPPHTAVVLSDPDRPPRSILRASTSFPARGRITWPAARSGIRSFSSGIRTTTAVAPAIPTGS